MYADTMARELHNLSKRRHVLVQRIGYLAREPNQRFLGLVHALDDVQSAVWNVNDDIRRVWALPRAKRETSEWLGFVNIRLTSEQKQEFASWKASDEEVYDLLVRSMESGHKFSLSYNKQNGTFSATLTGLVGAGNHSGRAMSAYAKEWPLAIRILMFKHFELAGGDWLSVGDSAGDDWG